MANDALERIVEEAFEDLLEGRPGYRRAPIERACRVAVQAFAAALTATEERRICGIRASNVEDELAMWVEPDPPAQETKP